MSKRKTRQKGAAVDVQGRPKLNASRDAFNSQDADKTHKEKFPPSIGEKIICAKSVLQAVRAAHNAESLDDENYDINWPLSVVIELLEAASTQVDNLSLRETSHGQA